MTRAILRGVGARDMYDDLKIAALASLDTHQVRQYGAKAANLGALAAIGMAVPPGVALGRDVLANYLRENGIDLRALERTHSMGMVFFESAVKEAQEHQAKIVDALAKGTFPPAIIEKIDEHVMPLTTHPLAVRSSCVVEDAATTSFAGQYATILGVNGRDELLAAIRNCWASQYDGRVLNYAISRRGLPVLVPSMAVLVQQMLNPDHAGVCFTEGPTPRTRHVSVIEAVPGLGEQLVSGTRTPHYFEIDASGLVVNRRLPKNDTSEPPDDEVIRAVALAARRIAAHFGAPQDVEWAVIAGQVYILQARPITVLAPGSKISVVLTTAGPQSSTVVADTEQSEGISLRDDLHEWLLEHIDPTLLRGAAYIVGNQGPSGQWEVEGYQEWNSVSTALIVLLLLDGGVAATTRWLTRNGNSGGPAAALSWLASQVKSDGTWGTDLWDTCRVVKTLLRCGVATGEALLRNAAARVREGILDRPPDKPGTEWFGAGFYAASLEMFVLLDDSDSARRCTDRLLATQAASGDFAADARTNGGHVPSEWHTAQVISALASTADADVRLAIERATTWLHGRQQQDGSWGAPDGPYTHFNTFFTAYAVLALLDSATGDKNAAAKACRWLKQRQVASGSFGDIASSLMAVAALQRHYGPAFSLNVPLSTFMRIQTFLSTTIQRAAERSA